MCDQERADAWVLCSRNREDSSFNTDLKTLRYCGSTEQNLCVGDLVFDTESRTFPFTFPFKRVAIRSNLELETTTMKRIPISILSCAISLLIACSGCKKSETPAPEPKQAASPAVVPAGSAPVSAEKNSFKEVTSQLDS